MYTLNSVFGKAIENFENDHFRVPPGGDFDSLKMTDENLLDRYFYSRKSFYRREKINIASKTMSFFASLVF